MMSRLLLLAAVALSLLAGCAGVPAVGKQPPPPRAATLTHVPVAQGDDRRFRAQAKAAYARVLELARSLPPEQRNPRFEAEALRRLGDITLASLDELRADDAATELVQEKRLAKEARNHYQSLLDNYPAYAGREAVLYQKARAEDLLGDAAAATATLHRFLDEFPESRHYSEAAFRLAELEFANENYARATLEYTNVLVLGRSNRFYHDAQYKKGWARFREGDYATAASILVGLLAQFPPDALRDPSLLSAGERERVKDSLRAVNLSFDNLDGVDSLVVFLEERDAPELTDILFRSLGEHYLEKGNYADAAETFSRYARLNPASPPAPDFEARAIAALIQGEFEEDAWNARRAFVEHYADSGDYWLANRADERPEVLKRLREYWLELVEYHARTDEPASQQQALDLATDFLAQFPADPRAGEIVQLRAELLFARGRFAEAAQAWERLAFGMGQHPAASAAASQAVVARVKALEEKPDDGAALQQLQGLALRYAAAFPQNGELPKALLAVARISLDKGDSAKALILGEKALALRSDEARQLRAANWALLGDARYEEQAFADAEKAYAKALAAADDHASDADGLDKAVLQEQWARSVYGQGEQALAQGQKQTAVGHFLRLVEGMPQSDTAAVALHDATAVLVGSQQWKAAITQSRRFMQIYPEHEHLPAVQRRLALALEKDGQYLPAATEYEALASHAETGQPKAWLKAASLFKKAGKPWRYARALDAYLSGIGDKAPAAKALELADFYAGQGDSKGAERWYAVALSSSDGTLQARAALGLGHIARSAYEQVYLVHPLAKNVRRKHALLIRALEAYEQAAQTSLAGVTPQALYWMGYLNRNYANALMSSERPADLPADAQEEFALMLEEQAIPFEDEAIALHRHNLELAQLGDYDQWMRKSVAELRMLEPARYARPVMEAKLIEQID